jgi:hypothetical protein
MKEKEMARQRVARKSNQGQASARKQYIPFPFPKRHARQKTQNGGSKFLFVQGCKKL